jgi:hypothetical protein
MYIKVMCVAYNGLIYKEKEGCLHPPQDAVAHLEGKWLIEKNIEPPVGG